MFLANIFGYILNFLYNIWENYGIAIIVFSIMLRIILLPITINQQKTMKKSGKIQQELKELQRKYKNNQEKLSQETMELYKREKMSPFSGCFSAIIQIFIILSVFWVVSSPLTYMKNVKETEIYEEYSNKVTQNGNQKASYKEIAMINLVEKEYQEINNKLYNDEYKKNNNEISNQDSINEKENLDEKNFIENSEQKENLDESNFSENNEQNENLEKVDLNNNSENIENITDNNKKELENKKEELEKLRINMNFLGLDLSKVPTQSLDDIRTYIIPILYVISSFISIKLSSNMQNKQSSNNENDKKENSELDAVQNMSKSMNFMMPIMSVSIAIVAPLGLALYWLASNVLMILERIILKKIINSKEDEENV